MAAYQVPRLALQVAMFGEVSDGNLATAIGVNTPTAADRAFYSKHASEKLSAFFSATENNKFYNYVKATVKFHDYGVHIHNMRLACQQLPIRSPGETAGQTATREQLLAQYEASIRDHIARAL